MSSIEALRKFGLSEKEAKVYLACLELGDSLASEISAKTDIARQLIYDILERLIDLGIASYSIKNNKKYFKVADPEHLIEILKDKEKSLENAMPELKEMQQVKGIKKPKIEVYEGNEGLKTIMEDMLRSSSRELISFGSSGKSLEILHYFMLHWHRKRIKNKIKMKVIYNNTKEAKERIKKYSETLKLIQYKFMPVELNIPNATLIYGNKVALTVWIKEPYGIVIESDEITKNYKLYFEQLWKITKS